MIGYLGKHLGQVDISSNLQEQSNHRVNIGKGS